MKRVSILSHGIYPDGIGGVHVAVYYFARFLKRKPISLALVLNDVKNNKLDVMKDYKIFPAKGGSKRFISPLLHLVSIFISLVKFRPDIVFDLSVFSYTFVGLIYTKLFGKKLIVCSEGLDIELTSNFLDFFMKKIICKYADQMLSVSYAHFPHILRFHPARPPKLLLNGTDLPVVDISEKEGKDYYSILFVGRLAPVKNISTLLQAFQKIQTQQNSLRKKVHLTICGDGPDRAKLEKLAVDLHISQNVTFSGFIEHDEKNLLYEKADIFVLPSISEGFPLVITEAISYGCPLVCSALPNLMKFYKENQNCLFFKPATSSEDLAEKLMVLLTNETLRRNMGENNIQLAKKYSWDNVGEELWNILMKY